MSSTKKVVVPEHIKHTLIQRTQQLINDKFKDSLPLQAEAAKNHGFNYIVDIYTLWRGRYFYLIAKYRNPRGDTRTEYFEVRTTRMEHVGNQRFNLAYMRHTDQWFEVFQSLTMAECLETIEKNEMFWPVH
jgi:hypothetical protein